MPKTEADYLKLMADRPVKFTPEEAGYQKATDAQMCAACSNFYVNVLHGFRVCQVMRTTDEDVKPDWTCKFWTSDLGETFPKLQESSEV
jgi:hypothetical protein